MLTRFFYFLNRYPLLIIVSCVGLSILFFLKVKSELLDDHYQLIIDSSLEPFISRDSGNFDEFKRIRKIFGSEEVLMIAIQSEKDAQKMNLDFFLMLENFTHDLALNIPNVERVISLINTPQWQGPCAGKSWFHKESLGSVCLSILEQYRQEKYCLEHPELEVSPSVDVLSETGPGLSFDEDFELPGAPSSMSNELNTSTHSGPQCTSDIYQKTLQDLENSVQSHIKKIVEQLRKDEIIQQDLISRDGKTAAVIVLFKPEATPGDEHTQNSLTALLKQYRQDGWIMAYASELRQEYEATRLIRQDLQRILPLSIVMITLVLMFSFRTLRGVIVPMVIVLLGTIWTMGMFGLIGDQLNLVTMACPPVLICVGSAYVIHVVHQFYAEARLTRGGRRVIVERTIEHITVPLVVTALTTVCGFAALMVSPIPAIQQLGLYSSIGITIITILSLTLAPWMMCLFPIPERQRNPARYGILDKMLHLKSNFLREYSKGVILVWVIIGGISLMGLFRIEINSLSTNFSEESEIIQDLRFIEQHLGGTNVLRLVFSPRTNSVSMLSADTVYGLAELKSWLLQTDAPNELGNIQGIQIDKVYTPVEYLDKYRHGLDNLTDDQVLHFFEKFQKGVLPTFVSENRELLQITVRMTVSGSTAFIELKNILEKKIPQFLPHLKVEFTGAGILASESADNIARSQIQSVMLALVIIFVILSMLFLSWKMGVIALYPNVVAVMVFFGLLGWFSIPVGITISVIASIALGIGVDDTIHFLTHYNENVKKIRNNKIASQVTIRHIGKPMMYTTFSLVTGFAIFVMSDMESQILFGALTAFTLFVCLITDLTFLPSIMMETQLITVWDYLGLKFDAKFLEGIDLFQKMSVSDAKIATLVAYTVELEKDDILFEEGESGNELYVILEGNITIYLDEKYHEERNVLAQLPKGKTFGEMGLFRKTKRTATAQASEKTRLLVITEDILFKLQQRNPGIASKLFLNLSKSLAVSIKNTDHRMVGKALKEINLVDYSSMDDGESEDTSDHVPIFIDIFQGMTKREKETFYEYCEHKHIPAGKTVYSRGDRGDFIMMVLSGKFVAQIEAVGEKMIVSTIGERDLVGENCLLGQDQVRQASVVAGEDSEALFLNVYNLDRMVNNHKKLAAKFTHNMVCMLSNRLEAATSKLYRPRYANRYLLNTSANIYLDHSHQHFAGMVNNISLTGIELELGRYVETGQMIRVEIFFRQPTLDQYLEQNTIELAGQIVWGRVAESFNREPAWKYGLKFVMLTVQQRNRLKTALDELYLTPVQTEIM
ncbi:MAG: MMPL family transporter [SAR324 cluster bacterium]|nr:MMPL family transporter [SAR324 cluster bacterium]